MNSLFELIWSRKFAFLGTFFLVFTLTYIVLLAVDFLPEPPAIDAEEQSVLELEEEGSDEIDQVVSQTMPVPFTEVEEMVVEEVDPVLPLQITIEKLDKTITVINPISRNIADLDTALLDGVVRHPDSATLDQEGTVFILGHSSYLPQVFNKNFQAFNGIQNLEWGDMIEVTSEDTVYRYRVEKVYRAKAQDTTVPIAGTAKVLTLATCNSFGAVDDRYIVEARQVEVRKM